MYCQICDLVPLSIQVKVLLCDAVQEVNFKKYHDRSHLEWISQSHWHEPWQADTVVFLNDVYFCAGDVLRLLQYDADMVCGLDFDDGFRDIWVARDANGDMLEKEYPFFGYEKIDTFPIIAHKTTSHHPTEWFKAYGKIYCIREIKTWTPVARQN